MAAKTPPPGMQHGITCESHPDGKTKVRLVKLGRYSSSITFDADGVAGAIATLLMAAHASWQRTGKAPQVLQKQDVPVTPITSIAFGPSQTPNHEVLAVQVGEAQLAFDIPIQYLGQLGQAMQAASARRSTQAN